MIKLIIFVYVLVLVSNSSLNGEIVQDLATFDVNVSSVTTSKINLIFNYIGGVYNATVYTVNINNNDYALCTSITASSCLVTGLNADTGYQFKVTAINNGTTLYSSFNVKTYTIISVPTIKVIQWQSSKIMRVDYDAIGGVPNDSVYSISINNSNSCYSYYMYSCSMMDVTVGETYNIHVQVVNDGHTAYADLSYVLLPFQSDFTVNVSQITSDGFTVEWTECTGGKEGATTYNVYTSLTNRDSLGDLACSEIVSPRTCKVNNLLNDTIYYVRVIALNPAIGNSQPSETITQTSPLISASTLELPLFIILLYSITISLILI
ncbi:hypothetical protein DLAC_02233 [Tieghemostelium lacteum]|uniref:Fibronectin type-III domain-containing protein n=1 Tax=Tieghemostelium lacteum TaxID=361077 RepID=A0A152A4H5_TIELA|nr:hypothetical protein DLAC_02233 [Tieghemostelium lacteum]|eukprot:KYR01129.1 hypothetical protein DLAC_02233 [Tieghemostelium lacteum]